MSRQNVIAALAVLSLPLALAVAGDRPPPHKPPQAAIDACAKSSRGSACSVTIRDRTITGTCENIPQTTTLACRPEHPPGPPPAAVDACDGASEGDACSFTLGDHSISGSCARGPDGNGPLACKPS
jgi:hypothetical protein